MWGKRTRTKIQTNKQKKIIRLALAFTASVLTAAAAGIFIWRLRKSKTMDGALLTAEQGADRGKTVLNCGSDTKEMRAAGTGRTSASRCAECGYRTNGVQNSMTVHPYTGSAHNRKRTVRRSGKRSGKRVFAAVAAVLAIAMVSGSVMQYMSPASKAMARESFGGIKQIVQEHNADNPFVILDIVPGKAVYSVNGVEYDLSLGTIGYFVNGQAPIGQDLKRIFTGEGNAAFYQYTDRQTLVEQVMVGDSISGVSYQEGYGGTGEELSAGNGWLKIFDALVGGEETEAADGTETGAAVVTGSVPTGRLYARVEVLDEAAGDGSHAGYDYELKSGNVDAFRKNKALKLGDDVIFIADEQGDYHVIFGNPMEAVSGYRVRVVSTDWRNYSDTTGVYQWDGSAYHYVSTVKELKENLGEEEGDGEEEGSKDDETDSDTDDDASNGDDKKDDPTDEENKDDNTGEDDGNGDDNTGDSGNGDGDNTGDSGNGDGGDAGDSGNGDSGNTGDSGNGDGGDAGDSGNGDGGDAGDSGNGDGGNTGDSGNGDGGNTGDSGNGDGGNTGDSGNGDGGNTSDSGNGDGGSTGDNGNAGNSASGGSDGNSGGGGNSETPSGENSAASQSSDSAALIWYRCIETGVSEAGDANDAAGNGDNSGAGDNGAGDSSNTGSEDGTGGSGNTGDNNGGADDNTGNTGGNGGGGDNAGDNADDNSNTGDNAGNNSGTDDSGNTGSAAGDNSGTGNGGNTGDDADHSGSGDGTETQPAEGEDGAYYILTFEYVSELEEPEFLYQVVDQAPIDTAEGVSRPMDSYFVLGMEESDAADKKLSAAEAEESNVAAIFTYVGSGNGTYKLTRDRQAEKQSDNNGELTGVEADGEAYYVEVQNAPVYIRCSGGNDWLKRYVFNSLSRQDNQYSDFTIRVNTVMAGEVTYEMIQDADLVYLEEGSGIYLNTGAVKKYIGATEDGDDAASNIALRDISETAIARLLYETVEELKPVIVDYGIVTNSQDYPDTKYQKLAKAFLKKDLTAFYDEMSKSDNMAQSVLMNVDKESSDYPNKSDNGYHYVNRNVYIVNGTALVSSDFPEEMDRTEAKAGFSEVLAAIRAENTTLSEEDKISEKISKAKAVQYIINYSVGLIGDYKDLAILELQPTANAVSDLHRDVNEDRGSVVLYWQREDQGGAGQQILRSSKKIETNVTVKSVVEFNGEYEDINSRYDMIFIGLDGQNLYRERNKDGDMETVYNDEELNGKVYHTGDRVAYGDSRYDASDITLQKKEALLDYLRAGYPIVVENDCFKGRSAKEAETKDINTHYIADNTQMYEFLKEAITLNRSEENEEGAGIYTIEDVHSSAMFMAQLNTVRPLIEQRTEEGGEDASDIIATVRTPEGEYKGAIDYRISSDRTGEDKSYRGELSKHLYLDMNYDGIFMPDEEVYDYLDESTDGGGRISVNFKEVCFGIVPWKLEVSDVGNGYRRDAIQGYFTINGEDKAAVRVLQVLDNTELTAANIQVQYEEMTNSMLRYYLNGAETLLDMDFKIETVTPAVLADRLAKNGAYLSGWDVVVLGFGNSGHPGDAVASAVNNYISAGGSVLVSSAGAQADKGKLGIEAQYMGQQEGSTYGALGIHSDEKHRYKGLKAVMFNEQPDLYVDKINEGTISKWPYQIGTVVKLGENTQIKAPEYLLDVDAGYGEAMTHATAWYTLNQIGLDVNAYNVSPRDAKNNYYIYSKGNVVYVGQSEYPYIYDPASGMAPDANEKGAAETMLFVNALMAAYNNSIHPAELSIVAGFSSAATKIESIAVPFDQEFKEMADSATSILDDTVDVYFKYVDNNLAPDKTRQIVFCYEDNTGAVPAPGDDTVKVTPFTSQIWTVENNQLIEVSADMLKPGKIYRIKAPVVALKQDDGVVNAKIYIAVQVDFNKSGQSKSVVGADSVSLNRAQLFLLE